MADRAPCNKKPLAEPEAWLIDPAWEGAMRQFDQGTQNRRDVLLAKESVAWFADVRALGYLRPPGLWRSINTVTGFGMRNYVYSSINY